MKKALCIISALLCILLTACGNDSSIGIVGGADGPTSMKAREKGEKAIYQKLFHNSTNFHFVKSNQLYTIARPRFLEHSSCIGKFESEIQFRLNPNETT